MTARPNQRTRTHLSRLQSDSRSNIDSDILIAVPPLIMNIQHLLQLLLVLAFAVSGVVVAQQAAGGPHGIFSGSSDIGKTRAGSTVYEPAGKVYRMTGGGADMWGDADAFHFSWIRLSGDASLTAEVRFAPGSHAPLEKAVLIFRQSLDPASPYADVAIHADGHITLQYRATAAGKTEDVTATEQGSTRLRIERTGDQFTAFTGASDGKLAAFSSTTIALGDPVYVGIGVCAHNAEGLTTVEFSNVTIKQSAAPPAARKD